MELNDNGLLTFDISASDHGFLIFPSSFSLFERHSFRRESERQIMNDKA
jgi:hypothetical protein